MEHKCPHCGTEYEGNFCPECGEKWQEEKTCPNCGAILAGGAKFCNGCGYSFVTHSSPASSSSPHGDTPAAAVRRTNGVALARLCRVLQVLPAILLALYGLLSLLFLAGPVVKAALLGNSPNGYAFFSDAEMPVARNCLITLLVFACLAVVTAVICMAARLKNNTTFGISMTFQLVFVIVSAVLMADIRSSDGGMGLMKAGACPVCFLVFAVLFSVFTAGGFIAATILKKNAAVAAGEEALEAAATARKEEKEAAREAFRAAHTPPVLPENADKRQRAVYKYQKRNYDKGKEGYSETLVWLDVHRVALGTVGTVTLAAIILLSVLVPYFGNHFRVGFVKKLELGATQEEVTELFGEPDETTGTVWAWYDGSLRSYQKRLKDLGSKSEEALMKGDMEQFAKLVAQSESIMKEMADKTFSRIEVTFSDGAVDSVLLDKAYKLESSSGDKEVKKCEIMDITGKIPVYQDGKETKMLNAENSDEEYALRISYRAEFTDGSYYCTNVDDSVLTSTSAMAWQDRFAKYEEEIPSEKLLVVGTVTGGVWKCDKSSGFWNSVTSLELPDGVTGIAEGTFRDTALYRDENNWDESGVLYIGGALIERKNPVEGAYTIKAGTRIICASAFAGCDGLTSITIPDSVTSIGGSAFYQCSGLTSVQWNAENCTEAGSYESYNNDHTIFKGCTNLSTVTFGGNVHTIPAYAFHGRDGLTSIVIPDSVTSIGDWAFEDCSGLTSVTIPNSVTSIGKYAFEDCSGLTSVTIGNGVTSIGEYAFRDCDGLTSVHITDLAAWCKIDFGDASANPLAYAHHLYLNGKEVTNLTIPEEITEIKARAFAGYDGLKSIEVAEGNTVYRSEGNCIIKKETNTLVLGCKNSVIPDSVTSIGEYAFSDCSGLTEITIPDGVTEIGYEAFYNCGGLTSVTIGNGVTSIGEYAFYGCRGLTSVTIGNGVTSIGEYAFYNCRGLTSIVIPDSVTSIGDGAFERCSGLTSVTWNAINCTEAGSYDESYNKDLTIFRGCTQLSTVIFGDNVKTIPAYAFYGCSGLTGELKIPDGVTLIGSAAFSGCSGLTGELKIPDSVKSIGNYAFYYCSKLTGELIIPDGVTSIGDEAFALCSGLTSIVIPESVTSIGEGAFYGCSGLKSITIPDSVTWIGESAFYDTAYYNDESKWEDDVLYIGNHLIKAKETISGAYTIKESTKTIASRAFEDCDGLTSVTIGNSVTSIGDSAFEGCSGLTSVTFENPDGWQVSQYSDMWYATSLDSSNLSDTAAAAEYLNAYWDYYWKRS